MSGAPDTAPEITMSKQTLLDEAERWYQRAMAAERELRETKRQLEAALDTIADARALLTKREG